MVEKKQLTVKSKKVMRSKTLIERFGFKDADLTTPEHDKMLLWLLDKKNALKMLEATAGLKVNDPPKLTIHCGRRKTDDYGKPYNCDWDWKSRCCSAICIKLDNVHDEEKYDAETRKYVVVKTKEQLMLENQQMMVKVADKLKSDYEIAFKWKPEGLPLSNVRAQAEYAVLGYNNFNIGFIDVAIFVDNSTHWITDGQCKFGAQPFDPDGLCEKTFLVEIKPEVKSIGELIRQINMYRSHISKGVWIVMTKTKGLKDVLGSQNIQVYEWEEK